MGVIVLIGALRGFKGLDLLDRVSLATVLVLTLVLGAVLLFHDTALVASGELVVPPIPTRSPIDTLLDITGRVAPWLALPLVLSAVLSQFSAAIADTAAADGNLRGLSRWFTGPRPYLISGAAAVVLAATVPTLMIVAIASRAFAAYYAIQALIALRTSHRLMAKVGFGLLAILMAAITVFALPVG